MAASDSIGQVSKIILKSMDAISNEYDTNISKNFPVNSAATYEEIDTTMRALNGLSTNTYQDTILVTNISVNQKMLEG